MKYNDSHTKSYGSMENLCMPPPLATHPHLNKTYNFPHSNKKMCITKEFKITWIVDNYHNHHGHCNKQHYAHDNDYDYEDCNNYEVMLQSMFWKQEEL